MPKEVITTDRFKQGEPWIEVGWRRDDYVQIGVRHENEAGTEGSSLWSPLSRDSINRLIRTLRRARDQAFGADA